MIEFDSNDLMVMLPELVLLGSTCAILLIDLFLTANRRDMTHWLAVLALAATGCLVWQGAPTTGVADAAFNGMFVRDGIAVILKLFVLLFSGAVLVYGRGYMRDRGLPLGEFYLLILFATLGAMLLASAGSLVTVYLGLELLALSSYTLVALYRDSLPASEAAV
jgi:NADH-quinone oxidoreductase subunit N